MQLILLEQYIDFYKSVSHMNNVNYKHNPFTGWQTFLILLCSVVASYFVNLFFCYERDS